MSNSQRSEFQNSVGGVMLRVPAGSFIMGSPESEEGHRVWERQREVSFATDFFLGQTPVTQTQYESVMGTNPTDHDRNPDAPIDSVWWGPADEFCEKLTTLDREAGVLPDDWEYRLPIEAEWEFACRAGNSQPRYGDPHYIAWYHENADGRPQAVGQKSPNAWGFHDMLGNIWGMVPGLVLGSESRSVRSRRQLLQQCTLLSCGRAGRVWICRTILRFSSAGHAGFSAASGSRPVGTER